MQLVQPRHWNGDTASPLLLMAALLLVSGPTDPPSPYVAHCLRLYTEWEHVQAVLPVPQRPRDAFRGPSRKRPTGRALNVPKAIPALVRAALQFRCTGAGIPAPPCAGSGAFATRTRALRTATTTASSVAASGASRTDADAPAVAEASITAPDAAPVCPAALFLANLDTPTPLPPPDAHDIESTAYYHLAADWVPGTSVQALLGEAAGRAKSAKALLDGLQERLAGVQQVSGIGAMAEGDQKPAPFGKVNSDPPPLPNLFAATLSCRPPTPHTQ